MRAEERREEIMRILIGRRHETMQRLAVELGVTDRTIRADINVLTAKYPLETIRGCAGCVKLSDTYHPHKNILSHEQQLVLSQLAESSDEHQRKVIQDMLIAFGSVKKPKAM